MPTTANFASAENAGHENGTRRDDGSEYWQSN